MKLDEGCINHNTIRLIDMCLRNLFDSEDCTEKDLTQVSVLALILFAGQCDALLTMRDNLLEALKA